MCVCIYIYICIDIDIDNTCKCIYPARPRTCHHRHGRQGSHQQSAGATGALVAAGHRDGEGSLSGAMCFWWRAAGMLWMREVSVPY